MGVFASMLLVLFADPADGLAKAMLPVYAGDAAEYTIALETAPGKPLELRKEPVFEWSNPARQGVQQGVVFLWLREGRPAALGCVFSEPDDRVKGRKVFHEFHALDPVKLVVTRPKGAANEWVPQAGLPRKELPDAPAPAAAAPARLVQMRRLAQEFTGHEIDGAAKRGELRVLPAPLYRYPEAKSGVVDGALFALVSTANTDPEVLLLVEAREVQGVTRWEYACGRFSDQSLYVQRKDKEVWSSVRDEANTFLHDPLHLFRVYPDKVVGLDGKLLTRLRATEKTWWGEFVPPDAK